MWNGKTLEASCLAKVQAICAFYGPKTFTPSKFTDSCWEVCDQKVMKVQCVRKWSTELEDFWTAMMMIAAVGPEHQGRTWTHLEWGEMILRHWWNTREAADSTTRKWKWLFMNGCEFKRSISTEIDIYSDVIFKAVLIWVKRIYVLGGLLCKIMFLQWNK
jgi:hypothetical protein